MTPEQLAELKSTLEAKVVEGLLSVKDAQTALKTALDGLATEITLVKSRLAVSLPGVDLGNKDADKFHFVKLWNAIRTGNWKLAQFEKEVIDQANEKAGVEKAGSTATGSTGGYVVPMEITRNFIELLYAQSVVMKMGASRINPTGIPFEAPKMVGGVVANWADEGAVMPESQASWGKLSMTPKYLTALVPMSDRMLEFMDPAAESLLRRDILRALDLKLDYGCMFGDGTLSSPIGLANQEGISTLATDADGDIPTYDFLLDLEGKVEDQNALEGDLGFVSNPAVFRLLRKQKVAQYSGQTDGQPLFKPIMTHAQLTEAIGKHAASTQISKTLTKGSSGATLSSMFYGNWAEMIVAFWGSLVIKSSEHLWFNRNVTCLKAVMQADVAIRHPQAFAYAPFVRRA